MDHDAVPTPHPGELYDAKAVAAMIGITSGTLREHVRKGAIWVPRPMGQVGGAWVWRGEDIDLEKVQHERPGIGRPKGARDLKPRKRPTADAAAHPRPPRVTGAVPATETASDGWWDIDA